MDDPEFMFTERPFLAAAKLLREAGEYKDAMVLAKKALIKFPKDPDLAVLAGLLSLDLQDPERAERFFRKALSTDPENAAALKSLGLLLVSSGQKAEGFDILLRYLQNVKWNDAAVLEKLVVMAGEINEEEKTITFLKEAWEMTLSPRTGFLYAHKLRLSSKYADALSIMQLLAKHSPTPEILNEYAIDLQHLKQFEKAIPIYELAIQKAISSREESEYFDSEYESQIDINVDVSIYLSNLSSCYLESGKKDKALEAAEKSLSLEPHVGYNWFAKAKAMSSMQRYQEAADTARNALEADRDISFLKQSEKENILLFQAESLRSHQQRVAEEYFKIEQLTERGPLDKAKILFGFSQQYHDATQIVKNALEQEEQKPGFLDQSEKEGLSLFQEQLKKNDQLLMDVLIVLLGGIQNYPKNLNFYFEAANIYEKLGKFDEAIKVLENAFQKNTELLPNEITGGERLSYYLSVYYILLHKNGLGENAWEIYVRFGGKKTEELLPTIELDLKLMLAGYIDGPAAQIIEQVYKHQPENPQSIQFMFKLRFEQGRLEDCISVLSQAVNAPISDKYRLVFLNNLGYIQLLQGNLLDATNTLAKALTTGKYDISDENADVFNHFSVGVAFYLDNKVLSANWVDKSKCLTSSPVQLWQTNRTIDAVKCNLVTLALARGDADEATALVADILSMPHEYKSELELRDLVLLFVARFRNDIKTARFAWQNYLKHKEVYVSEDIFKKIHPEFHAWLSQTV